ncbi:MAG: hypothetical protein ACE5KE_04550 [Methanosarcinales archaeon]
MVEVGETIKGMELRKTLLSLLKQKSSYARQLTRDIFGEEHKKFESKYVLVIKMLKKMENDGLVKSKREKVPHTPIPRIYYKVI